MIDHILAETLAAPASVGDGRLLCVDGPAGSGKTTLASALAGASGAPVVHMDDLLAGWRGMATAISQASQLLESLAAGETGSYLTYDWQASRFDGSREVAPAPLLILEGVGSGASALAAYITTLVWIEVPDKVRIKRGLARDGEAVRAQWEQWMLDEAALFKRERTRDRADFVLGQPSRR